MIYKKCWICKITWNAITLNNQYNNINCAFSTLGNKMREMHIGMHSKWKKSIKHRHKELNRRFNHLHLVMAKKSNTLHNSSGWCDQWSSMRSVPVKRCVLNDYPLGAIRLVCTHQRGSGGGGAMRTLHINVTVPKQNAYGGGGGVKTYTFLRACGMVNPFSSLLVREIKKNESHCYIVALGPRLSQNATNWKLCVCAGDW